MRQRTFWTLAVVPSALLLGCSGSTDFDIRNAVAVAALAEDGTAEDAQQPTNDSSEPEDFPANPQFVPRDCSLEAVHQRLVDRYDQDRNGHMNDGEQACMQEDFEGQTPDRGMHGNRPGEGGGPAGGMRGGPGGGQGHGDGQHEGKRRGPPRHHALLFIYDADGSGDLSEEERATLEADLAVRCENRQKWLLENYQDAENRVVSKFTMSGQCRPRVPPH